MWISPKQAAAEMSMTAFKSRYEQVVIPLGGDEHFPVDVCSVSLSDGSWTTPCGQRGYIHHIERNAHNQERD